MKTSSICFALIGVITRVSTAAIYPFDAFVDGVPFLPFVQAPLAPGLPPPIAFTNGPIYTSLTPSLHPIYHTPQLEVRNIIRSTSRDTAHFSGTSHRAPVFPFGSF
ncbi:unnamed protein product [Cylicocyclus nassatus]|uniref:Uncharacterized protein n=1 Tax=Cylicocyclus nassatus TaxID=53992 RepID=A0AA36GPZ7_CYLNA|nr:unnamed protein product [Cylicocyclus nassatus]